MASQGGSPSGRAVGVRGPSLVLGLPPGELGADVSFGAGMLLAAPFFVAEAGLFLPLTFDFGGEGSRPVSCPFATLTGIGTDTRRPCVGV